MYYYQQNSIYHNNAVVTQDVYFTLLNVIIKIKAEHSILKIMVFKKK